MERVSNLSKLKVNPRTKLHNVPETFIGFNKHYYSRVYPVNVITAHSKIFEFQLYPTVVAELINRNCRLCYEAKVVTQNDTVIPATLDVSCVNFIGPLAFQRATLTINGEQFLETTHLDPDVLYLNCLTQLSKEEKESTAQSWGYRADSPGKVQYTDISKPANLYCGCNVCNCSIYDLGTNPFEPKLATAIEAATPVPVAKQRLALKERIKFNEGLYLRKHMLRRCIDTGDNCEQLLYFDFPLGLICDFFSLPIFYPSRGNLNLSLHMQEPRKLFFLKPMTGDTARTDTVRLQITKIYLFLEYAIMEPTVRNSYYDQINRNLLIRVLKTTKTFHRQVVKKSTVARFSSIFSFSVLPKILVIAFLDSKAFNGDYEKNRQWFSHYDCSNIEIFINGVESSYNPEMHDMKLEENNLEHFKWYNNFIQTYGNKARSIEPKFFFHDCFVFCIPICFEPKKDANDIDGQGAYDDVSLLMPGTIDVNITWKALPNDVTVEFIGYHDTVVKFSSNGDFLPRISIQSPENPMDQ